MMGFRPPVHGQSIAVDVVVVVVVVEVVVVVGGSHALTRRRWCTTESYLQVLRRAEPGRPLQHLRRPVQPAASSESAISISCTDSEASSALEVWRRTWSLLGSGRNTCGSSLLTSRAAHSPLTPPSAHAEGGARAWAKRAARHAPRTSCMREHISGTPTVPRRLLARAASCADLARKVG